MVLQSTTSCSLTQDLAIPNGNQLLVDQAARLPPRVTIVEQPARKALRFRYATERRFSTISGVNSIRGNKTYPTIRVDNFTGPITIVVSCVTKEKPYRPHPHNLVGKPGQEGFKNGAYTIEAEVTDQENEIEFNLLRVLNVTLKDIKESLKQREEGGIDPFGTGFKHADDWKVLRLLDLSAIRLAFEVFLHGPQGIDKIPLKPIVSNVMYDKKAPDLHISEVIGIGTPVRAKTQIVLLCDKVNRKDTVVVVYEKDKHGLVKWQVHACILKVHKQAVIVAEMPPYDPPYYVPLTHPGTVTMNIQLRSLLKNKQSNSVTFEYIPDVQAHADWIPKNIAYPPVTTSSSIAQWQTISQDISLDSTSTPCQDLVHHTEREHSPSTGGVDETSFVDKLLLGTHSPLLENVEPMPPSVEAQSPQMNVIGIFHAPSPNGLPRNILSPFPVETAETCITSMNGLSLSAQNLLLGAVKETHLLGSIPARTDLISDLNEVSGMSPAYETTPTTRVRGDCRPFSSSKSSLSEQASKLSYPKQQNYPIMQMLQASSTYNVLLRVLVLAATLVIARMDSHLKSGLNLVSTHSRGLGVNNGSRGPHVFSELYDNLQLPHGATKALCVTHFPQQSQLLEGQQLQESLTTNQVIDSDKLMDVDSSELTQMLNKDPNGELHDLSKFFLQEDSESLSGSLRRLSTNY